MSFEEYKYVVRAELLLKGVAITELPKIQVMKDAYDIGVSVEDCVTKLIEEDYEFEAED